MNKDFEDLISKRVEEEKALAAAGAERALIEHRARYDSQPLWLKFMRNFYGYNTGNSRLVITVLTILFVLLKLTGIITWSWWWVLSPLWLPIVFTGLVYLVFFIVFVIKEKLFGK